MKHLARSAVAVAALASASSAQWTVVNLHPAGATESWVDDVDADQQSGYAVLGGVARASVWTGTAASRVDLSGGAWSFAYGVGGVQQAGNRNVNSYAHAAVWSGTSASWVDLNPPGAAHSEAYDTDSGQQVGYASWASGPHLAILWTGTAASWVNLTPAGESGSAYGVDAGQQVGYVTGTNGRRAALWTGTAASWVDLHPPGESESTAYGVGDGEQVGWTGSWKPWVEGAHAALWRGTASSWVDLHPAGATTSRAYDADGGRQAGYATVGFDRAGLWSGTAASWVDLHALLPASFTRSRAMGIFRGSASTTVVGGGFNSATNRIEGLMWVGPGLCYPDCNADGQLTVADFGCFQTKFAGADPYADCNSDGQRTVADFGCFQTKFVAGCP